MLHAARAPASAAAGPSGVVAAEDQHPAWRLGALARRALAPHHVLADSPHALGKRRAELEGLVLTRSEEHTSELQSPDQLVCRLLLEKKKTKNARRRWSFAARATASATCTLA